LAFGYLASFVRALKGVIEMKEKPTWLRDFLKQLDTTFRERVGRCEKCGKPKGGFVPASVIARYGDMDKAKEAVGICTCKPEGKGVNEND